MARKELNNSKPFKAFHKSLKPEFNNQSGGVFAKMDAYLNNKVQNKSLYRTAITYNCWAQIVA